ncbi:MAG: DUF1501 domain-containing protein [Gemmataceae bacterium]
MNLSRRDWLKSSALGLTGISMSGWLPVLAARAAQQQSKARSCILLWMDGGPPHTDTFDLKPDEPECGIFKPIATSVPGIQISELYPKFAKQLKQAAILRGMSTVENEHLRARVHLRTGYRDGQGGVKYPSIGSVVSRERGQPDSPLPDYVAIADRGDRSHGPGYFGSKYQPLFVHDPDKGVENLKSLAAVSQQDRRLGLLDDLEQGFQRRYASTIQSDHATVYRRAVQLMRTEKTRAFELDQEPAHLRDAYGRNKFGQGCLLARRLVEASVPFIEVSLGGWDTHFENNNAIRKLSEQCDPAMSMLIEDLKQRGLLDSTLVVWMGEFGRTPKFKGKGRDHYAKAWSTLLMGAGIRGGQVVGKTDQIGATVAERPVSVADFMATICQIMQVDYTKEYDAPGGRPVPLVQKGGRPVEEILR